MFVCVSTYNIHIYMLWESSFGSLKKCLSWHPKRHCVKFFPLSSLTPHGPVRQFILFPFYRWDLVSERWVPHNHRATSLDPVLGLCDPLVCTLASPLCQSINWFGSRNIHHTSLSLLGGEISLKGNRVNKLRKSHLRAQSNKAVKTSCIGFL